MVKWIKLILIKTLSIRSPQVESNKSQPKQTHNQHSTQFHKHTTNCELRSNQSRVAPSCPSFVYDEIIYETPPAQDRYRSTQNIKRSYGAKTPAPEGSQKNIPCGTNTSTPKKNRLAQTNKSPFTVTFTKINKTRHHSSN